MKKQRAFISVKVIFAISYIAVMALFEFLTRSEVYTLACYLLLSTLTFAIYAKDKKAAEQGKWRTPEKTLHLLSLLGGWPGAFLAQDKFRHKSKKRMFIAVLWLTVIANITLCLLFVSSELRQQALIILTNVISYLLEQL